MHWLLQRTTTAGCTRPVLKTEGAPRPGVITAGQRHCLQVTTCAELAHWRGAGLWPLHACNQLPETRILQVDIRDSATALSTTVQLPNLAHSIMGFMHNMRLGEA